MIEDEAEPTRRGAALLLAAAAAVFAAAAPDYLSAGTAPHGDDNSSHFAEILVIAEHLRSGETDFWFDQANLGYPLFLAYQPLPSLVMGTLTALCGDLVSPLALYKLSILFVWALMPAAWYRGGRWLGMSRTAAAVLGLLILVVADFRSFGLGPSSGLANGLYTQAWGGLLLPLAVGRIWLLLVLGRGGVGAPALLLALVFLCHAFLGLYASLVAGLLAIVKPREALPRLRALAGVYGVALLLLAFWLVPFLSNLEYHGGLPWRHRSEDGYPVTELLRLASTGGLFDHGRAPWLTALVLAGIAFAWRRRAETLERWLLVSLVATFALLLGRTTWGVAYTWIPLHGELEVIRYLAGLHFCGLALAALGVARIVPSLQALLERLSGPDWLSPSRSLRVIAAVAAGGILVAIHANGRHLLRTFDTTDAAFAGALATLREHPDSRFLVHKSLGSIDHFQLNLLPALAERPQLESFSRGYHDTLSLYYLEYFDFSPAAFDLYNLGAAVAGDGRVERLPESFRETWAGGGRRVFEREHPPGYFDFVRTPLAVVGDLRRIRRFVRFTTTALYERRVVARLVREAPGEGDRVTLDESGHFDFTGSDGSALREARLSELRSLLLGRYAASPFGSRVLEEASAPNEYTALVDAAGGDERLLLKASHHPGWEARIDGRLAEIDHVAPNLMALSVPPGRHEIRFRYRNPAYQKLLFAGSVAGVLAWAVRVGWRARDRG